MEKQTIIIPDGCKAEIRQENGKTVIVIDNEEKKRWRGELNSAYYYAVLKCCKCYVIYAAENKLDYNDEAYSSGNYFRTRKEAQAFCDDLNKAIKPIFDKAKRGEYDK